MHKLLALFAIFAAVSHHLVSATEDEECWEKSAPTGPARLLTGIDFAAVGFPTTKQNVNLCKRSTRADVFLKEENAPTGVLCYSQAVDQIAQCGITGLCCVLGKRSLQIPYNEIKTTDNNPEGPAVCQQGSAIRKVRCDGDHCDDMYVECLPVEDLTAGTRKMTTERVSEETEPQFCDDHTIAVGLECSGNDCDDIKLQCTDMIIAGTSVAARFATTEQEGCYYTAEFSEESGDDRQNFGTCTNGNAFVRGIGCTGDLCDNVRLYCCPRLDN